MAARGWRKRRFEDHYTVDPETGCWNWNGTLNRKGYGQIASAIGNSGNLAHRASYVRAKGLIPAGMTTDHLCRNRRCVNPEHLELVTNTENIRRGSGTKLDVNQVHAIRKRLKAGETQVSLAKEFGVTQTNIQAIATGKIWAKELGPVEII